MRGLLFKTAGLTLLSSSVIFASGWRIPEQSSNSVALSGAYVANSNGADAAYYNPANMSFNKNELLTNFSLMYIGLTEIDYQHASNSALNGDSKKENFLIPTMFVSSEDKEGVRYGLSITAPGGLSKRWDEATQKGSAEEFTLKIVEFNPVVSYLVNPNFSIAAGLRALYSEGVVKSTAAVSRDMEGDSIDYGYNLALSYKPSEISNASITYRSNVDLTVEGNAKLYSGAVKAYDGDVSVTVPLPAVLTLAYAHKFDKTTVEFEYDKTYWSKYKSLDFEYPTSIGALAPFFDDPKTKNWKNTDAYRIGVTHEYSDKLTLMAGFAIDDNPAPEENIGYELPDSDAKLYSVGCDYKIDDKSNFGFGYLLDVKESRTVNNSSINGEFSNAKAHLLSFSYRTAF